MSDMTVVDPVVVTDAVLVSSTIAEADAPLWSDATNYAIGAVVMRPNHKLYEAITGGVDSTPPEDATGGDTTKWIFLGPTNQWAMFDNVLGTLSTDSSPIEIELDPGQSIDSLGLLEISGADTLTVEMENASVTVYSKTVSLDYTPISSFYEWFYTPTELASEILLTDLPSQYPSARLKITLSGSGTVSCGLVKFGLGFRVGGAEWGVKAGIDDYSKKERDARFGTIEFIEGPYSKRISMRVIVEPARFNAIFRSLSKYRARPCLYIVTDKPSLSGLTAFGISSFELDVAYPSVYYCTFEVESLV